MTAELAALAMPHARVTFAVRQTEDPEGVERRRAHASRTGRTASTRSSCCSPRTRARPPGRIAKGASGGELSRVMLAVEVVFAGTDPVPTYVFDEVDAGVGGKAAVEIGRRLAQLARSAQVVVVTHLPQVAAFADRQLLVEKTNDGSVTRSGVKVLEGEDRVRELSRMLAGQEDSETARAHAEELLATARRARQSTLGSHRLDALPHRAGMAGLRAKAPGGPERWQRTNYAGRAVELYAGPATALGAALAAARVHAAPGPRSWPPGCAARTTTWSACGTAR